MKKTIVSLFLTAIIASPLAAFSNVASVKAASINTAIRGATNSTVYWYANDGKRYVFPNAATYYTWFTSFSNVQTISDSELFSIQLGGNVTYRPGAKLVKVVTNPKVYAVARGGILRHVTSESLAIQLYGYDWASKVQDLPDEFFINYTVGSPIYSTTDYNVSNEYNGVTNPNDALRGMGQNNVNNQNGSLSLTADRTSITSGQAVILTSDYNANLPSGGRIEIKEVRTNSIVKTCYNSSSCTVMVYPYQTGYSSTQYISTVFNESGSQLATQYSPVIYFNRNGNGSTNDGTNYINGLTLQSDRTSARNGDIVKLTANAFNSGNWSYIGNRIEIRDARTGSIVKTCYDQSWCVADVSIQDYNGIAQYQALIYDRNGNFVMSQFGPVIYVNDTSSNNGSNGNWSFNFTANKSNISSGESVTFTATTYSTRIDGFWIDLYDDRTRERIGYCQASACQVTRNVYRSGSEASVRFEGVLRPGPNGYGDQLASQFITLYFTDSVSVGQIPNTDIYIAPSTNVRAGGTVYLTASFTNLPFPSTDTIIRIYTEQSSTPVGTCSASVSCSVPYTISSSGVNTRVYGVASNRSLGSTVETARIPLVTF